MSIQYTHEHHTHIAVSMGFADSSTPPTEMYVQKRDLRHDTHMRQDGIKQPLGYRRRLHGKVNSTISNSLSPPQSSVTSELLPNSSSEYACDSDSHGRDCCSQVGYLQNQNQTHGSCLESSQGYATVACHAQQPGLDACASFSSGDKSMKHVLEELESALLGMDGDDGDGVESLEFAGDEGSFWTELLDEVSPPPAVVDQISPLSNTRYAFEQMMTGPDYGSQQVVGRPMYGCHQIGTCGGPCRLSNQPSYMGYSLQPSIVSEGSRTRKLLMMCAVAISERRMEMAEAVMNELRKEVSVFGDPMKRLAAYMSEGLVAKLHSSGFALYRVLKCWEAPAADVLSAMQKLFEICPYFKFAYMAANGAIAEALKNEARVHIFDFQIVHGTQWISLMQGLANRPGGPPSIRITTVEDPSAQGYPIGGMHLVRQRLSKLAESLNIPFEFTPIPCKMSDLQAHMIEQREGEALAVNILLQLHHLPDESVCVSNPRDRILRMMKSLNPKVMTFVEQEANTNTTTFFQRFMEVLDYYTAVFDSIDVALPRESKDRVNVEEQCLARDIVNVLACEGEERVERHELTGKWRARMKMAGFQSHPMSSYVNDTIRMLLKSYSESYNLKEEGEALFLGWQKKSLVVASAWH